MSLTRWPLNDFVSLREAMERLFEDSFIRPSTWTGLAAGQLAVPVDLWETPDAYHLRADVPGLTAEDLDISATADAITISGEMKASQDITSDGWLRQERRTGKFQRAFSMPVAIDPNRVEANFSNGVLELTLPKSEAVKPKTIKVTAK